MPRSSMGAGGGATSDRGSDGMASTMASGRRGMFAALRIEDLGVVGEKGTKVDCLSARSNTDHSCTRDTVELVDRSWAHMRQARLAVAALSAISGRQARGPAMGHQTPKVLQFQHSSSGIQRAMAHVPS